MASDPLEPSSRPRLSPILVVAWLLLTIDVPAFRLWQRWSIDRLIASSGEGLFEEYLWMVRAHLFAFVIMWAALVVGLWITAKARDSQLLRQATWVYLGRLLVEVLGYALVYAELIEPEHFLIENSPYLSAVLMLSGGALVLLHAHRSGASRESLVVPIVGHLSALAAVVFTHIWMLDAELLEVDPELLTWGLLAAELVYWLSWLALPREVLSLHGSGEPPAGEEAALDASGPTPKHDILVGAAWAGGGLLLTVVSLSGEGIGGRGVLAWGPIIYGLYRIIRGASSDRARAE